MNPTPPGWLIATVAALVVGVGLILFIVMGMANGDGMEGIAN